MFTTYRKHLLLLKYIYQCVLAIKCMEKTNQMKRILIIFLYEDQIAFKPILTNNNQMGVCIVSEQMIAVLNEI